MISIRTERLADVAAREALLDVAYGPARFTKPSQRLRERREPALSFVAQEHGGFIGTSGCGRSQPAAAPRCCSARSPCTPTAAGAASALP
jgi:hypothetical protein